MRILWIATAFYPAVRFGGNVTQAWEECRALVRAGADVQVLTIDTEQAHSVAARNESIDGVRIRYHPRTWGDRRGLAFGLMRDAVARAGDADLVHLNSPWQLANPFATLGARAAGRPHVVSLRGTFMPYALAQHRRRKSLYLAAIEGRVISRAGAILASNDREAALVRRRWPLRHVIVLPPVVDVERFAAASDLDIRHRIGIASDAPLVVFVGRNHPVKGLDLLLAAFAEVLGRHPTARLLIAGPDERGTRDDLKRDIAGAGIGRQVVLAGMLSEEDKAGAYRAADVVVMPSRQEGFGQVAAEAMAAGRAVVVTDQTGIASSVDAARAGRVVAVDDRSIASAIIDLLGAAESRHECGERGARFAAEHFAPRAVAQQMLTVYEQIIAERPDRLAVE